MRKLIVTLLLLSIAVPVLVAVPPFSGSGKQARRQQTQTTASSPANTYTYTAIKFDAATNYYSRSSALSNIGDVKTGFISCWFKSLRSGSIQRIFQIRKSDDSSSRFGLYFLATGKLDISAYNSSASLIMDVFTTSTSYVNDGLWHHVYVWWDLASSANRGFYIDGVAADVIWSAYSNTAANYTESSIGIGNRGAGSATEYFTGSVCELMWGTNYLSGAISTLYNAGKPGDPSSLHPENFAVYIKDFRAGMNSGNGGAFSTNGVPSEDLSKP